MGSTGNGQWPPLSAVTAELKPRGSVESLNEMQKQKAITLALDVTDRRSVFEGGAGHRALHRGIWR